MSEVNDTSTNEVTEPSELLEGNEDVNDSSIDSNNQEMTGAEAVEIEKKAKESGKTIDEYLKDNKPEKKAAKPPAEAKPVEVKDKVKPQTETKSEDNVKHKVKVNGVEKEVDIHELKRAYSLAEGGRKALQEGLNARKQAEEFVKLMRDPEQVWGVLEKLGYDPFKLAEEHLVRRVEEDMLSPEEVDTRNKLKKLRTYEEMELAQKREADQRRINEMKANATKEFEAQFTDALRRTAIPPTKTTVAKMAKYISDAAKMKYELTPLEAAGLVKEDLEKEMSYLYGESDGETLLKLLGEKNAEKILKARGKQVRSSTNYNNNPSSEQKPSSNKSPGYSWSDWKQEKYTK